MAKNPGNPNIGEIAKELSTGPKTELGKFRASLNALRGYPSNPYADKIPPEIRELYEWIKGYDTKQLNELLELKNMYSVLKDASVPTLLQKVINNEQLSKKDLDTFRLAMEMLVNSHKLRFGDKHIVEHKISVEDIRKQMMSDTEIIDAKFEVKDDLRQNMGGDRSPTGFEERREAEETERSEQSAPKS